MRDKESSERAAVAGTGARCDRGARTQIQDLPLHRKETRMASGKIACLLGDGFEDSEFRVPYDALQKAGYQVDVIGPKKGQELKGYRGKERVKADLAIADASYQDYDGLLIPGGKSP